MEVWPVQGAKARFSELLDMCEREGPQVVTHRGVEAAVLVPADEWRRITHRSRRTLKELLLADDARGEAGPPSRGTARRRDASAF